MQIWLLRCWWLERWHQARISSTSQQCSGPKPVLGSRYAQMPKVAGAAWRQTVNQLMLRFSDWSESCLKSGLLLAENKN